MCGARAGTPQAGRARGAAQGHHHPGLHPWRAGAAHHARALPRGVRRRARAHDRAPARGYARINRSPLGAAALATSSFALDRGRLAELLGCDGLVENAYDANHLAPIDAFLEVANALSIAAVQIGQFAQDLHAQYAEPRPWILLQTGRLTGTSSIMPQKRNPAALEQLRAQASLMLGDMQTLYLLAHNVRTGMFDYRGYDPVPSGRPLQVFNLFAEVLDGVVVDKERALEEVNAEYSTATEIADALAQQADVPFRIGHHFASLLTDYGRQHKLPLRAIPFAEVERIYREQTGDTLPLDEAAFRRAVSPEHMVFGRRGIGGPQPAEVTRMLAAEDGRARGDLDWVAAQRDRLAAAARALDCAFQALASGQATPP